MQQNHMKKLKDGEKLIKEAKAVKTDMTKVYMEIMYNLGHMQATLNSIEGKLDRMSDTIKMLDEINEKQEKRELNEPNII